jgi:hypothetical protein
MPKQWEGWRSAAADARLCASSRASHTHRRAPGAPKTSSVAQDRRDPPAQPTHHPAHAWGIGGTESPGLRRTLGCRAAEAHAMRAGSVQMHDVAPLRDRVGDSAQLSLPSPIPAQAERWRLLLECRMGRPTETRFGQRQWQMLKRRARTTGHLLNTGVRLMHAQHKQCSLIELHQ